MNRHWQRIIRTAGDRLIGAAYCVALVTALCASAAPAAAQVTSAQEPTTVQSPSAPPLSSPEVGTLPTGNGSLSFGQWLLSPTLGLYSFYDSNIHSSSTAPLEGPGFHIHPSILADFDTGIHDTSIYANIDSQIYPTLDYLNNTFDRQAGFIEKYAPLRDLIFTVQADYSHRTNANVLTESIPTPVSSSASPPPTGAEGVVGVQQTIVDPNDTYTLTATAYKEFNRAFIQLGTTVLHTDYENSPLQNFDRESYYGSGGIWVVPLFYTFADGLVSPTQPVLGPGASSFRARTGIGTEQVGLFQGLVYVGQQGSQVEGDGTAGGDIYGGQLSYFPTDAWNMTLLVDRLRNVSNITAGTPLALAGLPTASIGVPTTASAQITSITFRSNYTFSPQTSLFGVVSNTQIAYLDSSRVDTSWLASFGLRHQLRDNLTLTLDYQYTSYTSEEPGFSFVRHLVSIGAIYRF